MSAWARMRGFVNTAFVFLGTALTFYIGGAAVGLIPVRNASEHYTLFILAVVVLSGLSSIRALMDEQIHSAVRRFFWLRMCINVFALVCGIISLSYIYFNAVRLEMMQSFYGTPELTIGWMMTVSILILNWIHWGAVLTLVVVAAITYFFFGYLIESPLFMVPEYDHNFIMNYIALGSGQGFYSLTQDTADSIYFLLIYASVLFGVGTFNMVLEVGKAAGRRVAGGAAAPAIIGSSIVSSIMGVAVSNVVLTGRLTIPMMKKYGYSPAMAGAIEATASTSGQIMPPVLGLAAFMIAAFLNMPYVDIALAAVIPSLLYVVGVAFGVFVYAKRRRLPKLKEAVDSRLIWRIFPTFLASFGALVWLLTTYTSPAIAGLYAILIAIAFSIFQGPYRPSWKQFFDSYEEGLVVLSSLCLLLVAIGPLGQVMLTTNLSGRLGTAIAATLPDAALIWLIGAAILSIILGCGLPTPAAYLIVALAMVPFMQQLGTPALQAHFFVFYFAVYSALTPPVAVASMAAAMLAGAPRLQTDLQAMKLALATFPIPFAFVYSPSLMSFPNLGWDVVLPLMYVVLYQWVVAVACYGYFMRDLANWERWIFSGICFAGFMQITSPQTRDWDIVFGVSFAIMTLWLFLTRNRPSLAFAAKPAE